jgi:hypothetical protein
MYRARFIKVVPYKTNSYWEVFSGPNSLFKFTVKDLTTNGKLTYNDIATKDFGIKLIAIAKNLENFKLFW